MLLFMSSLVPRLICKHSQKKKKKKKRSDVIESGNETSRLRILHVNGTCTFDITYTGHIYINITAKVV